MMPGLLEPFDPTIPVLHKIWVPSGPRGAGDFAEPIPRWAYSVAPMQTWRAPRTDPIDVEALARTIADILIDVPDPEVYKKLDSVLIHGISYEIQGQPESMDWDKDMPIPDYSHMFGAIIHARRVQ